MVITNDQGLLYSVASESYWEKVISYLRTKAVEIRTTQKQFQNAQKKKTPLKTYY